MICVEEVAENAWRLRRGLYRILLPLPLAVPFVSVFLVESRGRRMLVDAGSGDETSLRALGRALKAIGVPAGSLDLLLLTHRHPDHAGGAAQVQGRWGGRVLLHPKGLLRRSEGEAEAVAWAVAAGVPAAAAQRLALSRPRWPGPDDLGPVEPLEKGLPLVLGDLSFDVVEVAGHCPGHVMLHERRLGWLISADQVVDPDGPNVWLVPGAAGDPLGDYLASLRRTAALAADLVLPSHGPPLRGGLAAHVGRQIRFQEAYLRRVASLLDEGPATAWQVAGRLAEGRNSLAAPFLAEVLAALRHLEATGRVSCEAGRYRPSGSG